MILFIALMIPIIIYQFYIRNYLSQKIKHDRVLYKFGHTRRMIMGKLRDNINELSNKDRLFLLDMLPHVSNSIHYFNEHKKVTFRIRNLKNFFGYIRQAYNKNKDKPEDVDSREILEIKYYAGRSYLYAIMAYTPFLGLRVWMCLLDYLIIYILKAILKIGMILSFTLLSEITGALVKYIEWYLEEQKKEKQRQKQMSLAA